MTDMIMLDTKSDKNSAPSSNKVEDSVSGEKTDDDLPF